MLFEKKDILKLAYRVLARTSERSYFHKRQALPKLFRLVLGTIEKFSKEQAETTIGQKVRTKSSAVAWGAFYNINNKILKRYLNMQIQQDFGNF